MRARIVVEVDVDLAKYVHEYGMSPDIPDDRKLRDAELLLADSIEDDLHERLRMMGGWATVAGVSTITSAKTYGVPRRDGSVRAFPSRAAARRFVKELAPHALQYKKEVVVSDDGGNRWRIDR